MAGERHRWHLDLREDALRIDVLGTGSPSFGDRLASSIGWALAMAAAWGLARWLSGPAWADLWWLVPLAALAGFLAGRSAHPFLELRADGRLRAQAAVFGLVPVASEASRVQSVSVEPGHEGQRLRIAIRGAQAMRRGTDDPAPARILLPLGEDAARIEAVRRAVAAWSADPVQVGAQGRALAAAARFAPPVKAARGGFGVAAFSGFRGWALGFALLPLLLAGAAQFDAGLRAAGLHALLRAAPATEPVQVERARLLWTIAPQADGRQGFQPRFEVEGAGGARIALEARAPLDNPEDADDLGAVLAQAVGFDAIGIALDPALAGATRAFPDHERTWLGTMPYAQWSASATEWLPLLASAARPPQLLREVDGGALRLPGFDAAAARGRGPAYGPWLDLLIGGSLLLMAGAALSPLGGMLRWAFALALLLATPWWYERSVGLVGMAGVPSGWLAALNHGRPCLRDREGRVQACVLAEAPDPAPAAGPFGDPLDAPTLALLRRAGAWPPTPGAEAPPTPAAARAALVARFRVVLRDAPAPEVVALLALWSQVPLVQAQGLQEWAGTEAMAALGARLDALGEADWLAALSAMPSPSAVAWGHPANGFVLQLCSYARPGYAGDALREAARGALASAPGACDDATATAD